MGNIVSGVLIPRKCLGDHELRRVVMVTALILKALGVLNGQVLLSSDGFKKKAVVIYVTHYMKDLAVLFLKTPQVG